MVTALSARVVMTLMGIAAGLAVYGLSELDKTGVLSERPLLLLSTLCTCFFLSLLAMTGPLKPLRALIGATALSVIVTAIIAMASVSFIDVNSMTNSPHAVLAGVILTFVPMPFWIAANGRGWRDYPTLFGEAWSIVIRYGAAWAFVALAWGVVLLSDALLSIVGITAIQDLLDMGPITFILTGGLLGLALGVVQEFSDYLTPYLILRLLRLLLPVVFVVSMIFLLALPFQGISTLFGQLSFALTLLTMAGAAATLVTSFVDQSDSDASQSPTLGLVAQAMSLALPIMAVLGAWAIWQRVAQYGWTPDRVFAAEVAALGLGYGVLYAWAVLRGAGWMARIRRANVTMALALLAVATLALTPVLNAERISTASLMARLADGRLPMETFNPKLLTHWGKAGQDALAALKEKASLPGQEALATRLRLGPKTEATGPDRDALLAELTKLLPLQPAGAEATRDIYLAALDTGRLTSLRDSCARAMPGGGPGCVMVISDLLPRAPGEEALLAEYFPGGFIAYVGLRMDGPTGPSLVDVQVSGKGLPQFEEGEALIRHWQAEPPAAIAVPLNQLELPRGGGVMLLP